MTESLPPRFQEAKDFVAKIFGNRPSSIPHGPKDVKQLWSSLERQLGPRESWTAAILRQLWGELFAGANKRRRSSEHERIYLQLLGYALRPGFGYSLDEWRCEQSFRLFGERIEFHKEKPNWNEFWILWRRISGGLSSERQTEFWDFAKPHLAVRVAEKASKGTTAPKGPKPEGTEELVRAAAAMEHLPAAEKVWLGNLIVTRINEAKSAGGPWAWSLGRLGNRVPLYGSAHNVVPPSVAASWIDTLIQVGLKKADGTAFAAAQLGRKTGDRVREIDDLTRERLLTQLRPLPGAEPWVQLVSTVVQLETSDEARVLGDTLPIGLQLAK